MDKTAPRTLAQWLAYLEQLHPQAIAMGLDRVSQVAQALGLSPEFAVITVGGTNGKGSCCAMLEAMLLHAGYHVGCYTSPHLLRYNERVRIGGREIEDEVLCRAFERIEAARGDTSLTYFEFGTLAAVMAFGEAGVDVAILEVGLGGRLDAVNVFDADCALVASVDLDHQDYLGDTREAIGLEKAGIFRAGRPAVCADAEPPAALVAHAREIGADLMVIDRDFGYVAKPQQWRYWGPGGKRHGLPYPALRGAFQLGNAAACLTALDCLRGNLPVTAQDVRGGLLQAEVAGRFQVLPGQPQVILDVAHNPHAARALAANLASMPAGGRTLAVCAMFKDKDIAGVVAAIRPYITDWLVADAEGARGASAAQLAAVLAHSGASAPVAQYSNVAAAWHAACNLAADNDKIIVFGSFLTVAAVMRERQRR
ncbi:MAG: bifunctional tetrahydrofolate synthase/dihydrofolate synthase [Betaproteobacteria bacterium]|nr:bifunctional tetrahydrofolate synthase/dihydrofolate synthase [Betaproteobacteria bacterium]